MDSHIDGDSFAKTMLAIMVMAIVGAGFLMKEAWELYTTAEEEKPNPIRNEKLAIVEDTLNPDDSRIVSRVVVNKQKFIIFKLGRNYYAFEEQK